MINVFGDNRSIGQRGPPGEDAFDLIQWAPRAARRLFQEAEMITIYFDTAEDGITKDESHKPNGLKNRGRGPNAALVQNFPLIHKIQTSVDGYFMMELRDSLFKIKPVRTGTTSPAVVIFVFSCKALEKSEKPRFLFSNENITRAVSVEERGDEGVLKIYSSTETKEIKFDYEEWSSLLLQYSCLNDIVHCHYILNDTSGSLDPGEQDRKPDDALYIGGHPKKKGACHSMASFEMYYSQSDKLLPRKMCECLLQGVMNRVDIWTKE